jgi:hypothetical protein
MRLIYLKAPQVVVWLGEEADARHALDICRQWKGEGMARRNLKSDDVAVGPMVQDDETYATSKEDLDTYDALLSRPWWSQTWILQEVIHSNTVRAHIGHLQLTWTT